MMKLFLVILILDLNIFIIGETVSIAFAKAAPNAIRPLHLTPGSVGCDLFSTIKKEIEPKETIGVDISLNMSIPKDYMGLITGRSSLALKGLQTHVGIIDSDFFGEAKVIISDLGRSTYTVMCGDRVGQITLIQHSKAKWVASEKFKADVLEWSNSDFSNKHSGFGSTGI